MPLGSFAFKVPPPPMPAERTRVALPHFDRKSETLDNGLRTELVTLPHLQSVTISLFVRAGSRYESSLTNGISHFVEHMLFRGTEKYPSAFELNRSIEELAGSLDACTHVDFTQFDLTLPPEHVLEGMARLAEIVCCPIFGSLPTEKKIIREELLEELDDEGNQIDPDNVARRLLFPNHPLGFPIAGTVESIDRVQPEAIQNHLERYYTAQNAALCVAGPIEVDSVSDMARKYFGALRQGTRQVCDSPTLEPSDERFAFVHDADSQTHVRVSFPMFGLDDSRVMPLRLLERVLDDGMSARLHHAVCDVRGLAYDAFADGDLYEDCGVFDLGASVQHEMTPDLISAVLEVVQGLRTRPVEADELSRARARYIWDLRTMVDDPESINTFLGTSALFDLEDTLEGLLDEAQSIDADALIEVAESVFDPEAVRLTCVGVMDTALVDRARSAAGIR